MALSDAARVQMLDTLRTNAAPTLQATYASLHTASPGTTGASEVAGGGYARQPIAWNAATPGDLDNSNTPVFNVPAGTVTHFGLWTAATGGAFVAGGALSAAETYAAPGTYTLNDADVTLT